MIEELAAFLRARYSEARTNGQALLDAQPAGSPLASVLPDFFDLAAEQQRDKVRAMVDQLNADLNSKLGIVALCETETEETGGRTLALRTLLLLVQPFSQHPDYRSEWRP
jgi:hypothetical protein